MLFVWIRFILVPISWFLFLGNTNFFNEKIATLPHTSDAYIRYVGTCSTKQWILWNEMNRLEIDKITELCNFNHISLRLMWMKRCCFDEFSASVLWFDETKAKSSGIDAKFNTIFFAFVQDKCANLKLNWTKWQARERRKKQTNFTWCNQILFTLRRQENKMCSQSWHVGNRKPNQAT